MNVVEEMALASGTPVPPVYVMEQENSINAFAAGYSPDNAVIGITRSAIEKLSRDELQGVVARIQPHLEWRYAVEHPSDGGDLRHYRGRGDRSFLLRIGFYSSGGRKKDAREPSPWHWSAWDS